MRPARLRDSLANSLWLIPMLFAAGGAGLALITLAIDSANDYDLIPQALTGPPEAAQTILTTFIGALVTLISIVLTVITVASSWRCSSSRRGSSGPCSKTVATSAWSASSPRPSSSR
jgi:uncharacterized membrane protein